MIPTAKDPLPSPSSVQADGNAGVPWMKPFETLLQTTGQVIYKCDLAGDKMMLFGNVERLIGSPAADLQGLRSQWAQRIHPDDLPFLAEMETATAKGETRQHEYRFCRKDGVVIFLRDTCSVVEDEATKCLLLVGTLIDVTEQRNLRTQLQHLQKKQVLGELAGGVAHDFNNLLTIFNGYTEILQEDSNPGDPQCEFLEEMAKAVERAKALTTQLLNFSRKAKNPPGVIPISAVMLQLCRMLGRIAPENIEWVMDVKEDCGWVAAEHQHIETLLINLVMNAFDAMIEGGRLAVELTDISILHTNSRVTQDGWMPGPYVQITVRDTGIGMDETVQSRIFEPYFTTKSQNGASGLGLSICADLAKQLGGRIIVESLHGKGSAFHIFLPQVQPPAGEKPVEHATSRLGRGESILVVEDDIAVQKTLVAMLCRLGYKVSCASNGDEALRAVAQNRGIRLIICDLIMPLMGGIEFAKKLRQRLPDAKLVLTSGYVNAAAMSPANDRKTTFLPKPLSCSVLAYKLRELLDA